MTIYASPTDPSPPAVDSRAETQALADAAAAAGHAPSVHHVQPWRWRLSDARLDLFVDHDRFPHLAEPNPRLTLLSCGTALHHAFVSLAADGWHAVVSRLPATEHPDHLAQIRLDHRVPVEPAALLHLRTTAARHTVVPPALSAPVDAEKLTSLTAAVESEGARLQLLRPDEVLDLVVAADHAARTEVRKTAGGNLLAQSQDRTALFAVLYGTGDRRLDWLRAGEALSAAWLTATEIGLSLLPLPATIEMPGTRDLMRRRLPGAGHPYLLVRFGTLSPTATGLAARRTPATDQRIERV
jgi:hypothetical protein